MPQPSFMRIIDGQDNPTDRGETMTLTTPRWPTLSTPRTRQELVLTSESDFEYHGDTYFEPISSDWAWRFAASPKEAA